MSVCWRAIKTVSRLGLELGLGSEPYVVGPLGSRVWVSAGFQTFGTFPLFNSGENVHVRTEIVRAAEMSGEYIRGGDVLHSNLPATADVMKTDTVETLLMRCQLGVERNADVTHDVRPPV